MLLFTYLKGRAKQMDYFTKEGMKKLLEEALKEHLYYSMKRMRRSIEVDYKDYFEEEDEEGRFVI